MENKETRRLFSLVSTNLKMLCSTDENRISSITYSQGSISSDMIIS